MVGGITLGKCTGIDAMIILMLTGEGAETAADIKFFFYEGNDFFCHFRWNHTVRKRYGINLIRPDMIVKITVHDVIETLFFFPPEFFEEGGFYTCRKVCVMGEIFAKVSGKGFHYL